MASLTMLNTHLNPALGDRIDHHLLHIRDQSRIIFASDIGYGHRIFVILAPVSFMLDGGELRWFGVVNELFSPVLGVFAR